MQGTVSRIKSELKRAREARALARDFHAASPRMQEELSAALRRSA